MQLLVPFPGNWQSFVLFKEDIHHPVEVKVLGTYCYLDFNGLGKLSAS